MGVETVKEAQDDLRDVRPNAGTTQRRWARQGPEKMNTDLTFITNEKDKNLSERFKVLIKDTKFFDVLVGYFYTSGFYAIYKSLENTEKLRILIGISTNRNTHNLIQFSHAEAKEKFSDTLVEEMGVSEDNHD